MLSPEGGPNAASRVHAFAVLLRFHQIAVDAARHCAIGSARHRSTSRNPGVAPWAASRGACDRNELAAPQAVRTIGASRHRKSSSTGGHSTSVQ
jgi:hypothetical protein